MFWLVQERSTRQQIQKKARCATTMRSLIFLALGHTSRLLRSTNTRIGPATIPTSITTATPGNSRVNIIGSPPPRRRRLDCRSSSGSSSSSSRMASTTRGDVDDGKAIVVDPFCFRQFAENKEAAAAYGGTVFSQSLADFEATVNERYGGDESLLQEGYAPFCKHLFLENDFTGSDAVLNVLKITDSNQHLLVSEYSARNEKELPVLTRYFPKESVLKEEGHLPVAKYLDLILYSREQINKESAAMGSTKPEETAPWGIVSIKAQDVNHELPMTPITAMRNALGKDEGGSGIPLDRESYLEAVAYWKDHATVS